MGLTAWLAELVPASVTTTDRLAAGAAAEYDVGRHALEEPAGASWQASPKR